MFAGYSYIRETQECRFVKSKKFPQKRFVTELARGGVLVDVKGRSYTRKDKESVRLSQNKYITKEQITDKEE